MGEGYIPTGLPPQIRPDGGIVQWMPSSGPALGQTLPGAAPGAPPAPAGSAKEGDPRLVALGIPFLYHDQRALYDRP
jgi:hypothetical protein